MTGRAGTRRRCRRFGQSTPTTLFALAWVVLADCASVCSPANDLARLRVAGLIVLGPQCGESVLVVFLQGAGVMLDHAAVTHGVTV